MINNVRHPGKTYTPQIWVREKFFMGMPLTEYIRNQLTPFNIIAGFILLIGIPLIVLRFSHGLEVVTHGNNDYPWGFILGFGLFAGVPLAAGGFVLASAVYLFGLKEYHPLVRPAILTGLLGYLFAVIYLLIDLGRPWRLPYPMFVSYGPASVLFLVAWHVALYLSVQFLEFCPAVFEWLGAAKFRQWAIRITIGVTIFGVILSTLHQSALGALFLLAKGKLHPLWYSPFLPVFFFISSIFAGLSIVIAESTLSSRFFKSKADHHYLGNLDNLTLGLGKAASVVLFTYFGLKVIGVAHGKHWDLLSTPFGYWFLIEMFLFVLFPCALFAFGSQRKRVKIVRFAAFFALAGIILNRLTVVLIAFNWDLPVHEIPHWKEFVVVLTIITIHILTFRWIVNRMPVLREDPGYKGK